MSLSYAEPRLAPLGNTFLACDQEPRALKRSHSFSGYVPYHQWQPLNALEPEPRTGRGGGAPQDAAECGVGVASDASASILKSSALEVVSSPTEYERAESLSVAMEKAQRAHALLVAAECVGVASDASASIPKSSALEVVSSPTEYERAESICEESTPELRPDTGSNTEEHVRLSCSRGRALAPVPTGAGPGWDFMALPQPVATTLSGRPQCPVPPSPSCFGSQMSRSAVNLSVAMEKAQRAYALLVAAEEMRDLACFGCSRAIRPCNFF